ncbi:hypothetical protein G6F46_000751 [Rhizopus delemar]|uniref:NADP-dependent oxidoreductase domain-containing protein n=2 Tax=Rhizopus TaxID=4842 RepID=A0A9P7CQ30_9FUNG|nr:hypothetical protein G6F55_004399 [Rhizopus delemar]KAG1543611.1 hypothetical protein G6F51_006570 [Rhizopus arrhizus]KAG1525710.1 hypothetical protein G6F52_003082 [Rhizopus delemar]KAG1561744.1 hypothetical protein G6F49_001539 [Rhizopus delemar]KAG1569957.1 hypothetical protein G6F50_005918 [Rhizopus delemar]
MEDLVVEDLPRNIGVSNFNVQLLLDLLTYCKYKLAALEIEYHSYPQQKRLVDGTVSRPTAYLKPFFEYPVIQKIAKKHNHGEDEILLKRAVQRGIIGIPKTVNVSRMKTNLNLFSFNLDQDDMNEIASLDCNARFNDLVEEAFGYELPI